MAAADRQAYSDNVEAYISSKADFSYKLHDFVIELICLAQEAQ